MDFSMTSWREYCHTQVEANTDEQKARLARLIDSHNPENETAWANLAADVKLRCFYAEAGGLLLPVEN